MADEDWKEINCNLLIEYSKLKELIELSEENNMEKNIIVGLTLYYEMLSFQAKGYKLAFVPTTKKGDYTNKKPLIFLNTEAL